MGKSISNKYVIYHPKNYKSIDAENLKSVISNGKVVVLIMETARWCENTDNEYFLTKRERDKSNQFVRSGDCCNYTLAHSVVNYLYSNWIGCSIERLPVAYGDYQKPFIKNSLGITYNISHTEGCVVIGFSTSSVGIDIERQKSDFDFYGIAESFFCNEENHIIGSDYRQFFRYWVAKESYVKALGTGFYKNIHEISVVSDNGDYLEIYDLEDRSLHKVMLFHEKKEYILGVCIRA